MKCPNCHKRIVRCKVGHHITVGDDGRNRRARPGMLGTVVVINDARVWATPYSVVWSNGARGFYSRKEFNMLVQRVS